MIVPDKRLAAVHEKNRKGPKREHSKKAHLTNWTKKFSADEDAGDNIVVYEVNTARNHYKNDIMDDETFSPRDKDTIIVPAMLDDKQKLQTILCSNAKK